MTACKGFSPRLRAAFLHVSACLLLAPSAVPQQQAAYPGSAWDTADPAAAGFDAPALRAALGSLEGNAVVVRHGKLVAVQGDPGEPRPVNSVSKTFTSIVFAVLLGQGKLRLGDVVPGSAHPGPPPATYRQFLNMTSDYGLIPHAPGTRFAYHNPAVQHYGSQMARQYFGGQPPDAIIEQVLWSLLGREDKFWFEGEWSGAGGGFRASARDLARIGLLFLREGRWRDRKLIPAWYVRELYKCQIPKGALYNAWESGKRKLEYSLILKDNYSYGWWNNAGRQFPELPTELIYAWGANGNNIIVIPRYDLVVAKVAEIRGRPEPNVQQVVLPILKSLKERREAP